MPPPPPPPPISPATDPVPKAAKPVYGKTFDPWNSSATGHQRADNALGASTGWRASRNKKLMSQFAGGAGGGQRVSDTVGEGARDWDPRVGAVVPPLVRMRAKCSVADMLAKPGAMRASLGEASVSASSIREGMASLGRGSEATTAEERSVLVDKRREEEGDEEMKKPGRRLFDGVVVYLNGSTHPLISDHKLKHVLAEHGGSMSSHLGRRRVTHVILGRPAAGAYGSGSGGGLAGGKLQREIAKMGGPGVKFVGVQVRFFFLASFEVFFPPLFPFPSTIG